MFRLLTTVLFASLLVAVATSCSRAPKPPTTIVGAWEFHTGQTGGQRGLLVVTDTHYSMMFVRGNAPREQYPEERRMTDAETVVAYNSVTANSGRYRIVGDSLIVSAYMANDPNLMYMWPNGEMSLRFRIEADTMTWLKPDFIGLGDTVTLQRMR